MDVPHDAVLLRIFTSVNDRCGMSPLYVAIVEKALAMNLAGATVLRSPLGFGHSSRLHKGSLFPRAEDLPVIIEIVDSEEKIDAFLPVLDGMMESGLVTLEKAKVLRYGRSRAGFLDRLKSGLGFHLAPPVEPADAAKK